MGDTLAMPEPEPSAAAAPRSRPLPPEVAGAPRVGRYYLANRLGSGGMGLVHRAWDPDLSRWVALKFLKRLDSEKSRAVFEREARLAASLDHPNIAKIFEIGEHEGAPFLAMPFIDGTTLGAKMKFDEKIAAVRAIAEAIRFAHGKGIIHRDLKPANVMVDRAGQVFVMDFGLAKESTAGESLTGEGSIVGTPEYMAPEQARGAAGAQSDVYSIGAILYDLVTGRAPFVGETAEVISQVMNAEPVWPRKLAPGLPADLEAIVLKALEKSPARRYRSAAELLEDLDAWRDREPLRHAKRPTPLYVLGKKIRKQPLLWTFGAAAVLAIAGGATFGTLQLFRAKRAAEEKARVEREERAKTEAKEREARLRLANSYLLRARDADASVAAIYKSEAFAACPSALARAIPPAPELLHLVDIQGQNAAFSPDGRRAVTGTVLWECDTGRAIATLAHEKTVLACAFEGDRIATAGEDYTARLWDANGAPIGKPLRHEHVVTCVALRTDRLATVSADKTLRFWDAATGRAGPVVRMKEPLQVVAWSPDGRIVVGGRNGLVAIVSAEGEILHEMRHESAVWSAAFGPDGVVATASSDRTARVWDANGAEKHVLRHDDRVVRVVYHGSLLATGSWDRTARLWDGGTAIGPPMRHDNMVGSVSFSPDGAILATASEDCTVRLWDVASSQPLGLVMRHAAPAWIARFSPDGRRLLTIGKDATARLWRLPEPPTCERRHRSAVTTMTFRGDLATGSVDGTVRHGDRGIECGAPVRGVAFRGDSMAIAAGQVVKFEGNELRHDAPVVSLAIGAAILTGAADNQARYWTNPMLTLSHSGAVVSVAIAPDGRLATGSYDSTAKIWSATGELLHDLRHDAAVTSVAFSPDGKLLATTSWDFLVRLWSDGKMVGKPLRHEHTVETVRFSPDGAWLLTGSADRTARIWETRSGEPVALLRHEQTVLSVAFGDGRIATGTATGIVRTWDVRFLTGADPGVREIQRRTGLRLDAQGEIEVIPAEEWRRLRP